MHAVHFCAGTAGNGDVSWWPLVSSFHILTIWACPVHTVYSSTKRDVAKEREAAIRANVAKVLATEGGPGKASVEDVLACLSPSFLRTFVTSEWLDLLFAELQLERLCKAVSLTYSEADVVMMLWPFDAFVLIDGDVKFVISKAFFSFVAHFFSCSFLF